MDEPHNPGNVISDEQWKEVGVRMFFMSSQRIGKSCSDNRLL